MSQPRPRVAAFIDGANMYYTQRDKLRWWIDWKKLRGRLDDAGDVVFCMFYTGVGGPSEMTDDAFIRFLDMLAASGYSIEEKQLKTIYNYDGATVRKANLDVELVLDMFNQIDNYDIAFLFSGDGDFERPLRLIRDRGKRFKVVSAPGAIAAEIRRLAGGDYIDLSTLHAELAR